MKRFSIRWLRANLPFQGSLNNGVRFQGRIYMEVPKGKLASWLTIALLVGFWVGIGAYWHIIRYSFGDSTAIHRESRLRDNVVLLKMLDEKRPDIAMRLLEDFIQADIQTSTEQGNFFTSHWAKGNLEKQVKLASLALKDRSKTLVQLMDEAKK